MSEDKINMKEAAEIAHVTKQAIYMAIRKKRIKAWMEKGQWITTSSELQAYRESKHTPENRLHEGKQIFDIEEGKFSVSQAATLISHYLKTPYPRNKLYYLIKIGELPASRIGSSYIVTREAILKLIKDEYGKICDPRQLRFA